MKIGSLYTVKDYFWLLFPTKETALAAFDFPLARSGSAHDALHPALAPAASVAAVAAASTSYWSKQYNCEVTYFSPDAIIVFLEEDGKYKKVLTSDGKIGWTWLSEKYNECFEEVLS